MNIQQLRAQIAALQNATMDENKHFRSAYDEGKYYALSAVDALLSGMEKMKEEMMENVIDGLWIRRNKYTKKNVLNGLDLTHNALQKFKNGDKVKVIIIKED